MSEKIAHNTDRKPPYMGTVLAFVAETPSTFIDVSNKTGTQGLTDRKTYDVEYTGSGDTRKIDMDGDLEVDKTPDDD